MNYVCTHGQELHLAYLVPHRKTGPTREVNSVRWNQTENNPENFKENYIFQKYILFLLVILLIAITEKQMKVTSWRVYFGSLFVEKKYIMGCHDVKRAEAVGYITSTVGKLREMKFGTQLAFSI